MTQSPNLPTWYHYTYGGIHHYSANLSTGDMTLFGRLDIQKHKKGTFTLTFSLNGINIFNLRAMEFHSPDPDQEAKDFIVNKVMGLFQESLDKLKTF